MIEGLRVRCTVGPVEVLRLPFLQLAYRRRAVVTRAELRIPDPEGAVRAALAVNQPVHVRFGYRGENLWHEWEGTVENVDQPRSGEDDADAVTVRAVGLEKALATTLVTESFYKESARAVASRLLARTGLPVAGVDIPDAELPHQVFSRVPVARALKQLETSLTRAFGADFSRHAVWLGADGLRWSAGDEPGALYTVETACNLVSHTPPLADGGMGVLESVLLPGLRDGMQVRIRDTRRDVSLTTRALEVIHTVRRNGNITEIRYGKEQGWG